jgi:exodeoxyribonuclease VII large subunit
MPEPAYPLDSQSADPIYSVTELTRSIRRLLEGSFFGVWVEGELSNVKLHTSGHLYFTLKDDLSCLRGVMFRRHASKLRFDAADGQKVRVYGSITVYEPKGEYQINTTRLDPVGIGELELAFRQLYEKLEKEGLFHPGRKRAIPRHPRVVGLVTSDSGAAVRDLLSVLERRAPHVEVVLRPARVQGAGAAADIVRALVDFEEWGGADVVIIGRGGGSLEDLWAFNEEIVARAIAACRIPIISAVGHEIDFTIADYAADLRAPTPSAAAEIVASDRETLLTHLDRLGARLGRGAVQGLRMRGDRVMLLARSTAFRRPMDLYRRRSQDVDALADRLETAGRSSLSRAALRLEGARGKLHALSPLAVLERGYAIVRGPSGAIVRRAGQVAKGERIDVRLAGGELRAEVEDVREDGMNGMNGKDGEPS